VGVKIAEQINYDTFVSKLPERLKKPILTSNKTQETVQKLVFVYQLSIDDMVEVYTQTAEKDGLIDLGRLSFNAQLFYSNKKKDIPVVATKHEINGNGNQIHYLKTVSPVRIIENYVKNDYQL